MISPRLLLLLGILALFLALRSYRHPVLRRLSLGALMAGLYCAVYFRTGSLVAGLAGATGWVLWMAFELLLHLRGRTLPLERRLHHRSPPGAHLFPELPELTEEVEESGFEHIDDAGWEDDEQQRQFFRLSWRAEERTLAAICFLARGDYVWSWLSLCSRGKDGLIWCSRNYPFPCELRFAPASRMNRLRSDRTFLELLESHRQHLQGNGIGPEALEELSPESILELMQQDLRSQVAHNLATGLLIKTGESQARYTWRGMFFLWSQVLRELVRFS